MPTIFDPFRFVLMAVAGCMNHRQLQAIEYLCEENQVLREQLDERCLRLSDDQRRRLAARARGLGRKLLAEVATIVTPETLLRWHPQLIAHKYDGSRKRGAVSNKKRSSPVLVLTVLGESFRPVADRLDIRGHAQRQAVQ
jgi:hypothetical protein